MSASTWLVITSAGQLLACGVWLRVFYELRSLHDAAS